jgi:hypothetical protein
MKELRSPYPFKRWKFDKVDEISWNEVKDKSRCYLVTEYHENIEET